MDAIWPEPTVDIDVGAHVFAEARGGDSERPWVTLLMISSIDGAAALDGVSGGLGGPADKAIFAAMRSMADAIVVGGGTARSEDYGPVPERVGPAAERRAACGQPARPQLAVISKSLSFDLDSRLFAEASSDPLTRPILYTTQDSPTDRRDALTPLSIIVEAGEHRVEPTLVVADLAERGHRRILLEGGPRLNSDFFAAGLIDEIHLSLAPLAVGGDAPRIVAGKKMDPTSTDSASPAQGFALSRIWAGDGILFLRYLLDRSR